MKRSSERGQVTTQFVVLTGILVTVTIAVLAVVFLPVRLSFINIATCIISDVCKEGNETAPEGHSVSVDSRTGDIYACEVRKGSGEKCSFWDSLCLRGPEKFIQSSVAYTPRIACGLLGYVVGSAASSSMGGVLALPGFAEGAALCGVNTQDWKAKQKRVWCCCCNMQNECDGTTTYKGNVICVLNDSDGFAADIDETLNVIDDISGMIKGNRPGITENDSINSMKKQILLAVSTHGAGERIELIGHSEGAAILSNAIWQLVWEQKTNGTGLTPEDLARLDVVILGPAEWRFPRDTEVTLYENSNENALRSDPVPKLSDKYRELKLAGYSNQMSEVHPGTVQPWPCTLFDCHDAQHYLENRATEVVKEDGGCKPGVTIMVNGIRTEDESQQGNCDYYQTTRYGSRQCLSQPSGPRIFAPE
ncbi:MAG: hypothetical protein NT151_04345 [Acidobacteria bacterium]|nr:hypothetical protein [Acidobacteriota bacterium]